MSYVYFIACPAAEQVKIGFARDPWSRLTKAQVDSPVPLFVRAILPGTRDDERAFHKRFARFRERGEWFNYTGELREFVAQLPIPIKPSARRKLKGPLGAWIVQNGHTLESFGKLCDLGQPALSQICSGKRLPRREAMQRIWDATNHEISPNVLFGLTEAPEPRLAKAAA